jgi:TolA-binding protein
MLKLGQSLIAMGQKKEGCTTLDALKSKYPKASDNVTAEARRAHKAARCR